MKASVFSPVVSAAAPGKPALLTRLARTLVLGRLQELKHGQLVLIDGNKRLVFGAHSPDSPIRATLFVHDPNFYTELAFGGSVGAGEAYMAGLWSCDDLTTLIQLMILNSDVLDRLETGWARVSAPVRKHTPQHESR